MLILSIGHNWEPSWILKTCHCRVRYFKKILDVSHPQKYIFRGKYGKIVNNRGWVMEMPGFGFSPFSVASWPLFQNDQFLTVNMISCYE